ncbi:MAG: molybdopterin-dependent oxidoreductase [Acidimicrobiales bacterium]|nr:molybdopterin-dependent oxidoreductase [Acidimicrobiales bacterium]MDG2216970.1 molybdopterin-dependent oxidoreductase [Acidimicrobiales bacterium]
MTRRRVPTAAHWGVGYAVVEDGRVVAMEPRDDDPRPSPIRHGIVDAVDGPARVRYPHVRRGFLDSGPASRATRGIDKWVRVDWDTALDLAASHLDRIRTDHGNESIYGGSYGWASAGRFHHAQSQVHRFLNSIGGYTRHVDNYSFAAAMVTTPHVVGNFWKLRAQVTPWTAVAEHGELVVAFGGIASRNTQVGPGGSGRHELPGMIQACRDRGVEFIGFGPVRSDLDVGLEAEWNFLRPGSDMAAMLGIAHTLITEDLHDREFLDRYTVGADRLIDYITGVSDGVAKTAAWASEHCGVPAEDLTLVARRMAKSRTLICTALGVQRAQFGEQPMWMTVALAALLGQIGLPGAGFGLGYAQNALVGRPGPDVEWASLPEGTRGVDTFIPVARIADLLLHPGETFDYNGGTHEYPDTRAVYWSGGNPFHHHQDLFRLREAFRQPEIVIVNEPFFTATAQHADIVFPTTTTLERNDWASTNAELVLTAMHKAIEPVGESRNDYDIFAALAERMGACDTFTEGRTEQDWLRWFWELNGERAAAAGIDLPDYESARARGFIDLPHPGRDQHVMFGDFRADPDLSPLPTPSGRFELFSETVAGFGYDDCPGHPAWFAPDEWLGNDDRIRRHPLHLISNQPATRLHGQLDDGSTSQASKIDGREPLTMHPEDAASRGLVNGDLALVRNDRGACVVGIRISDEVMPRVVQLATGAWFDPYEHPELGQIDLHGNPNTVTRDVGTSSLAQGPSSSSTLVEVEPLTVDVPPVRAHDGAATVDSHGS